MVKTGEEIIIEGLLAQFKDVLKAHGASKSAKKPLGDEALRIEMRQLTKNIRSMQSQAMADAQHRRVRENIERRAELRDKTSVRMPNIARLLTGGAESPVAGFGRMQKAATKPFKAIYDYQKAQDESAAFKEEMRQEKSADPNFTMSKKQIEKAERLEDTESGAKKRAGSGMGKNLMGKRMQSMIGKVGKFMESSKGQGMMAGGMMGASILTMVIKKAMEASPMLQQMLKIMNVAMTLFLRPIGDFIGGMLKPIMLFFLREIAVPMLKKGKDFIKFGEAFGKNLLGFMLKPIETIHAAIVGALGIIVGPEMAKLAQDFDGMKAWMSEQKMSALATEMGFEGPGGVQRLVDLINDAKFETPGGSPKVRFGETQFSPEQWDAIVAEFGTSVDNTVPPLEIFKTLMTDLSQNTYTYVNEMSKLEGAGIAVAEGMGAITGQFTLVSEATGKVVTAMQDLENQIKGGTDIKTDGVVVTTTGGTKVESDTTEMPEGHDYSSIYGTEEENQPIWVTKLKHWSNAQVHNTPAKMLAAFQAQIRPMMKTGGVQDPKKLAEYNLMTAGGTRTVAEGIQAHFEKIERLTALMANDMSHADLNTEGLKLDTDDMLVSTKGMVENFLKGGDLTEDMVKKLNKMIASMNVKAIRSLGFSGKNMQSLGFDAGSTLQMVHGKILPLSKQAISYYASKGVKTTPMQHGGMINEPIWGIGASGREYTLGEAGPEMVTPMGKGSGGIGPVTINVNVDSINNDVDLEKIKPVIERALHEVHARRGII